MVIYNGQQERVISDAISECSSFTFDSSCFEKRSESHSNGMLMYSSTEMGVFFLFFLHSLPYKTVADVFSVRNLHKVFPKHIIW